MDLWVKGQVTMEFASLTLFLLVILVATSVVVTQQVIKTNTQTEARQVHHIMTYVTQEFAVAAGVKDGYVRQFTLPQVLPGGINYSIAQEGNRIFINSSHYTYDRPTINVTGSIRKGNNTITKINGKVYLNS